MSNTENIPLMMDQRAAYYTKKKTGKYNLSFIDEEINQSVERKEYWEDESLDEDRLLFADNKQRGTQLIWNDFCLTSIEYLQWLALIQATALNWPWPENWVRNTSWIFAVNLDIWEMTKVYSNSSLDLYKPVEQYATDSTKMPFPYWATMTVWASILALLLLVYIIIYGYIHYKQHPFLLIKIANLQRVYIVIFQILAIPFGVAVSKVFHCVKTPGQDYYVMDVDNTQLCFLGQQWAFAAAALGVALPIFIVFPIWLIRKTKTELIFSHASGHEAYLQLKETEYVQGLDVMYVISGFHIFSSFRLRAAHFRSALHLMKFVMVLVYAGLNTYNNYQAIVMTIIMLGYMISLAILRPYRVSIFNTQLIISYLMLTLNLLIGALRTSFNVNSIRSVWFTPEYTTATLIVINGFWLLSTLCILAYLLMHHFGVFKKPIWPSMTSEGVEKLGENTKKFMKGVLKARHVIERSMRLPPLFAPAHELSRQVQIINSYCREAEMLRDPLQDTLWHLLDEIIETHAKISPHSLFADSVKESIRSTAAELMVIMPTFAKRLAQREYDFLLVSPLKRRMLLKMFCLGMFVNKINRTPDNQLNKPALEVVWNSKNLKKRPQVNHLTELIPEVEEGPRIGKRQLQTPETLHRKALILEEEYQHTHGHEDSLIGLDSTSDDQSIDIDAMMEGIPSRLPTTSNSAASSGNPSSSRVPSASIQPQSRPPSETKPRSPDGRASADFAAASVNVTVDNLLHVENEASNDRQMAGNSPEERSNYDSTSSSNTLNV